MKDKNKKIDYFYTRDIHVDKNEKKSLKNYFIKLLVIGLFAATTFLIVFVVLVAIKEI